MAVNFCTMPNKYTVQMEYKTQKPDITAKFSKKAN